MTPSSHPTPDRPDWIKVKGLRPDVQDAMTKALAGCNTVCLSAKCPNLADCFARGVATFMIGGSVCTRACRFCGVKHGRADPLDPHEPLRVADAASRLGLRFVVITSVARDDLEDGGAAHFAETVQAVRERLPDAGIEVLIPDFGGSQTALGTVLESRPGILNHNVETVRRLTPKVRSKATYQRSIGVLNLARRLAPDIPTKSGLMLGLGETRAEVLEALGDLADVGCRMVTIGQYLQPRADREMAVGRYWTPAEFEELKEEALATGFSQVASGPFVRSSYMAEQMAQQISG